MKLIMMLAGWLWFSYFCLAPAQARDLGAGTHEFADRVFIGEAIHIEGTRFVHLESTTSRFVRCTFSNTTIRANEAVLAFEDCTFLDTPETILLAEDCRVTVRGCRFERSAEAINLIRCTGEVLGNTFRQIGYGADAIDIDFDPIVPSPDWTPVAVLSNLIDQCSGDGIDLGSSQARVGWNRIANCADKGISLGEGSSGDIHDNVIENARIGIAIKDGANPVCHNNTLSHCRFGIRSYEKENGAGAAFGELHSNRFFRCAQAVSSDRRSLPFERGSIQLDAPPTAVVDIPFLFTNRQPVVINEVAHRPAENAPYREFVELLNTGDSLVDLTGWALVDAAYHAFPPGTVVRPGDTHLVRFPANSLEDEQLVIRLVDRTQTDVDTVEVFRTGDWPRGDAPLELLDPSLDNNLGGSWENSVANTGTPNRPNSRADRVVEPFTGAPVVISELMYHPPNESDEFVELHNHGSFALDLTGWTLGGGIIEQIPFGTVLLPGGYLVLRAPFGDRRLSNRGERIDLRDRNGGLVDRVDYRDRGVWPRQADGEGASLALRSARLDNNQASAWFAEPGGSPGAANSFSNHAEGIVHAFAHRPVQPAPGEVIEVHMRVEGVPRLQWREETIDPQNPQTNWQDVACALVTNLRWIAAIPAQTQPPLPRLLAYRILVADQAGAERVSSVQLLRVSEPAARAAIDLLLTIASETELLTRPLASDLLLPTTMVADRQIFQRARLRYRGQIKRDWAVKSFRVDLRDDHPFEGEDRLNLNGKRPLSEVLATQVFHREKFPTPRIRLVDATIGSQRIFPYGLTERQYPDPATQGWGELDLNARTALADRLGTATIDAEIDIHNWIDWFALTAVLGDAETLLSGVDGNHAVSGIAGFGVPGAPLRLQPLDLDIAFAAQPPRNPVTFENSRLHPPAAFANDLPARFLRHPTFQRAYYDRMLELIDTLLRTPAFDEAAAVLFADRPFSLFDTRDQLDRYLQVDLAQVESEIRALLPQAGWQPRPWANPTHLPYSEFWVGGTMALPNQVLWIDGVPAATNAVDGTNWCVAATFIDPVTSGGPAEVQRTTWQLSSMPLERRSWTTGTQTVEVVFDNRDPDLNGLPTSWETYFGLTDALGDPDGDGLSNLREFELGSDPWLESRPRLELVRNATGGLTLIGPEGPPPMRLERGFPWQDAGPAPGGTIELDTAASSQVFRLVIQDSSVLRLGKP